MCEDRLQQHQLSELCPCPIRPLVRVSITKEQANFENDEI